MRVVTDRWREQFKTRLEIVDGKVCVIVYIGGDPLDRAIDVTEKAELLGLARLTPGRSPRRS